MKIYDISQEVFSCKVYPGDPVPKKNIISSMNEGAQYNLTELSMCAHNGTHIDAPSHFFKDGKTIDEIPLCVFVGDCYLARYDGELSASDAQNILKAAANYNASERILIAGDVVVGEAAARIFAEAGVLLLGVESQTFGPEDAPMAVHKILLGAGIALLEGIRLETIPEGVYFLNCAPLNLGESDGAPCRALLVEKIL